MRRIGHCRGFGIQSPTDFMFVREVVNEHWPYYAYTETGKDDNWLRKKMGQLYMRLANYMQPAAIADMLGYEEYLHAGCRKANISTLHPSPSTLHPAPSTMLLVPADENITQMMACCNTSSMMVIEDIGHHTKVWQRVIEDNRATVTFDLYYCGIAFFNDKRHKQNYIVNF